ncbi:MAG: hypothetical protein OEY58_19535 [Gammaproteobacteria bacterium]|nr:hypothetical protein [Gammaproteobacteria bacterium]
MEQISLDFIHKSLVGNFFPVLIKLIYWGCVLLGLWLCYIGVSKLMENATSSASSNGTSLAYILSGILLIYLEPSAWVAQNTLIQNPDPFLYAKSADPRNQKLMEILVGGIYIMGLLLFVRGIHILRLAGSHSVATENAVFKGITLMVLGVLAMNILQSTDVVANLFGVSIFK